MLRRKHNFCAGPCTLPVAVLEEMRDEFPDYRGAGMSLVEMSHRAAEYDAVHQEARRLALEVFRAPEDFDVLFIQGGAMLQFAMVAMNLLRSGQRAGLREHGGMGEGGRSPTPGTTVRFTPRGTGPAMDMRAHRAPRRSRCGPVPATSMSRPTKRSAGYDFPNFRSWTFHSSRTCRRR